MERDGVSRTSLCLEQKWRAFEVGQRPGLEQDADEIGQEMLLIRDKITAFDSNPADINPRSETLTVPVLQKDNNNEEKNKKWETKKKNTA